MSKARDIADSTKTLDVDGGTIKLDGNYPVGTNNVALGDTALDSNVSGNNNTALGHGSLTAQTGSASTAVGASVLAVNTGNENTAVGAFSMGANTTGTANVSVGLSALASNTTANNNTAVGYQAGYNNTTGTKISALGYQALNASTANYNTALGYWAAKSTTSGATNTAIGGEALRNNTTGAANVALGAFTLASNTTANSNTAVGYDAMTTNTTGATNTALGNNALRSNTTASNNTAVGFQAGYTTATGDSNTFVGEDAGYSTVGNRNTFVGREAGRASNLSATQQNTFVGCFSGRYVTSGAKNSIVGAFDGNQGGVDIRTSSNNIVLSDGDGNVRVYIDGTGLFHSAGIYGGTTAQGANVHVNSQTEVLRSTSSARYKNSIQDATHGLTELLALRSVTYKGNNDGDAVFGGLIAEEVHDAGLTEFVQYDTENRPDALAYGNMVSLCIKAIQEQQATITALEARITALENA